jgi:threonine synthase
MFYAYKGEEAKQELIFFFKWNFGNICAGIIAKNGLAPLHFVASTNVNDTVSRFFA